MKSYGQTSGAGEQLHRPLNSPSWYVSMDEKALEIYQTRCVKLLAESLWPESRIALRDVQTALAECTEQHLVDQLGRFKGHEWITGLFGLRPWLEGVLASMYDNAEDRPALAARLLGESVAAAMGVIRDVRRNPSDMVARAEHDQLSQWIWESHSDGSEAGLRLVYAARCLSWYKEETAAEIDVGDLM